jgi:hypothetical protein
MGIGRLSDNWKVGNTKIYEPSPSTSVLHTSISSADSGRTEDGYMHNTWVRTDIIKVNMVWKYLTGKEVEVLIGLMQGKEFTLTYEEYGTTHTADVYVAEVTYSRLYDAGYDGEGGIYENVTASAVEM